MTKRLFALAAVAAALSMSGGGCGTRSRSQEPLPQQSFGLNWSPTAANEAWLVVSFVNPPPLEDFPEWVAETRVKVIFTFPDGSQLEVRSEDLPINNLDERWFGPIPRAHGTTAQVWVCYLDKHDVEIVCLEIPPSHQPNFDVGPNPSCNLCPQPPCHDCPEPPDGECVPPNQLSLVGVELHVSYQTDPESGQVTAQLRLMKEGVPYEDQLPKCWALTNTIYDVYSVFFTTEALQGRDGSGPGTTQKSMPVISGALIYRGQVVLRKGTQEVILSFGPFSSTAP